MNSIRPWQVVNPEDGRTVFHGRNQQECDDYIDECGSDAYDLYRDGLLIRSGLEFETCPCDGPSDADSGLRTTNRARAQQDMHTQLMSVLRNPRLLSAYRYGKWRGGYLHVGTSVRGIIRDRVQSADDKRRFLARSERETRRALYLGTISALRAERRLMAAFSL